jgi:hypothetical protein
MHRKIGTCKHVINHTYTCRGNNARMTFYSASVKEVSRCIDKKLVIESIPSRDHKSIALVRVVQKCGVIAYADRVFPIAIVE